MTDEPVKCEKCNVFMDRQETQTCTVSYAWIESIKEYDEIDKDWFGNCDIKYVCPNCGDEIVD